MSTAIDKPREYSTVVRELSESYGVSEKSMIDILKKGVFRGGDATQEDLLAAMILCREYRLNPVLKHIHAIPNKGSMLLVVGVDGWIRIINDHPQFDGVAFEYMEGPEGVISCTCSMHRKDRTQPIVVTEYMDECFQKGKEPWERWPKRMLRHKALIQCARIAFGLGGIIDDDEAERFDQTPTTTRRVNARTVRDISEFLPPPTEQVKVDGEIVEAGARGDLLTGGAE